MMITDLVLYILTLLCAGVAILQPGVPRAIYALGIGTILLTLSLML